MKYWEREKLILDLLKEQGSVSMNHICELTGASVATVRRDFDEIQKKGLAKRSHGGLHLPEPEKPKKRYMSGTEIVDEIDFRSLPPALPYMTFAISLSRSSTSFIQSASSSRLK